MNVSKLLAVIATILFGVAFILALTNSGDKDIIEGLLFGGLTAFAGAHAL